MINDNIDFENNKKQQQQISLAKSSKFNKNNELLSNNSLVNINNNRNNRRKDITFNIDSTIDVDSVEADVNEANKKTNNNIKSIKGLKNTKVSATNLIKNDKQCINYYKIKIPNPNKQEKTEKSSNDYKHNTYSLAEANNIKKKLENNNDLKQEKNKERDLTKINNQSPKVKAISNKFLNKYNEENSEFISKINKDGYLQSKTTKVISLKGSKKLSIPNVNELLDYKVMNKNKTSKGMHNYKINNQFYNLNINNDIFKTKNKTNKLINSSVSIPVIKQGLNNSNLNNSINNLNSIRVYINNNFNNEVSTINHSLTDKVNSNNKNSVKFDSPKNLKENNVLTSQFNYEDKDNKNKTIKNSNINDKKDELCPSVKQYYINSNFNIKSIKVNKIKILIPMDYTTIKEEEDILFDKKLKVIDSINNKYDILKCYSSSTKRIESAFNIFQNLEVIDNDNIIKLYALSIVDVDKISYSLNCLTEHSSFDLVKLAEKYKKDYLNNDIGTSSNHERNLLVIMKSVLKALQYLENKNLCHGYISPKSINFILVKENNNDLNKNKKTLEDYSNLLILSNDDKKNKIIKKDYYKVKLSTPLCSDLVKSPYIDYSDDKKYNEVVLDNLTFLSPSLITFYSDKYTNKTKFTHNRIKSDIFSVGMSVLFCLIPNEKLLEVIKSKYNHDVVKSLINKHTNYLYSNNFINLLASTLIINEEKRYNANLLLDRIEYIIKISNK